MQIRVLGCSGSIAAGNRTTSFLVDDDMLIDAGTGVGDLTLDELARIDHIFISHSHLDHVLAIGLLADSVARRRGARGGRRSGACAAGDARRRCARISSTASSGPTSRACPTPRTRCCASCRSRWARCCDSAARHVEVLPAAHTVPAVGFAVHGSAPSRGAWVFSGDTGPNPALWERLAQMRWPRWSSRPPSATRSSNSPRISRHLCPALLRKELAQLGRAGRRVHHPHQAGRNGGGDGRDRPAGHAAPHPPAGRRAGDGAAGLTHGAAGTRDREAGASLVEAVRYRRRSCPGS